MWKGLLPTDTPRELHLLRPDRVSVVSGTDGWAQGYDHRIGDRTIRYNRDETTDWCAIAHFALFHPLDDHYGFPPLQAARMALDVHNAANTWNKALLDNSARPSGALVYAGEASQNLSDDQFERLKQELEDGYTGASRAGRPLLLEGGLDWKAMGYSPQDMDFVEARNAAARDIALAFGVPPMLLGIPGDNTYSQLSGGQSRLCAPDAVAPDRAHSGDVQPLARAALRSRPSHRHRRGPGGRTVGGTGRSVASCRGGQLFSPRTSNAKPWATRRSGALMQRLRDVIAEQGGAVETLGLFLLIAKFGGAVAGSLISIAFIIPRNRREAFVRFCVGFIAGLVFGGTAGVKIADYLGILGRVSPNEIALVGATTASLAAWWSIGGLQRLLEAWTEAATRKMTGKSDNANTRQNKD